MFFDKGVRSIDPELVLSTHHTNKLYLIPKAWAFSPNVYNSDLYGFANREPRYRIRNGVGVIRIQLNSETKLLTRNSKAEIFQEVNDSNVDNLKIVGAKPKWFKHAWFDFDLSTMSDDDYKKYVYYGDCGYSHGVLGDSIERFIKTNIDDIEDIRPALKCNPLFYPVYGFSGDDGGGLRVEFHSGVSLNNKRFIHHHLDESNAEVLKDVEVGKLDEKTNIWIKEHMSRQKELMDNLEKVITTQEEAILKKEAKDQEKVIQIFQVSAYSNKTLLLLRNRYSNEVKSELLGDTVIKLTDGGKSFHPTYYAHLSRDWELLATASGRDKYVTLEIYNKDPDALTAMFETQDGSVKFHVIEELSELKRVIETGGLNLVYYGGSLNILSFPEESAQESDKIIEFLEDYINTQEGNW